MSNDIQVWIKRYGHESCGNGKALAKIARDDREFYDSLPGPEFFLTGICHRNPLRAQWLIMGTIGELMPDPGTNEVLTAARAVALDLNASQQDMKTHLEALRAEKTPADHTQYYFGALGYLLAWRLGETKDRPLMALPIYRMICAYLRKPVANTVIFPHLKKMLPYEKWILGVREEAYAEEPYKTYPRL